LEELVKETNNETAAETRLQKFRPRGLTNALLKFNVVADSLVFGNDFGIVDISFTELGQGLETFIVASLFTQPTGRVRNKRDKDDEQDGGNDLGTEGCTPGHVASGRVSDRLDNDRVDAGGNKDTKGNHELVDSSDGTTNGGGGSLSKVDGSNHGYCSDSKTREETSDNEHTEGLSSRLESTTSSKEDTTNNDRLLTTNSVNNKGKDTGTKDTAKQEHGSDETRVQGIVASIVVLARGSVQLGQSKVSVETVQGQDLTNDTDFITKEQTTHTGGKRDKP